MHPLILADAMAKLFSPHPLEPVKIPSWNAVTAFCSLANTVWNGTRPTDRVKVFRKKFLWKGGPFWEMKRYFWEFLSSSSASPYTTSSRISALYDGSWSQKTPMSCYFRFGSESTDFNILFAASQQHYSKKTCILTKHSFSIRVLKFISGVR